MSARRAFCAWRMVAEAVKADERKEQKSHEARMRSLLDPLRYMSDRKFQKLYRLTKPAFLYLCALLRQFTDIKPTQRVSLEAKVLCALLFYAKGSYQCAVGQANHFSQEATSVYITEVTKALLHPIIQQRFLKFPTSRRERDEIKQRFYELYGFPGVIGCVDGSHFKIFKPKKDVEHLYYCRKNYHSINVQMICGPDGKILAVNPKFGGASHDAFVWENSKVNQYMQNLQANNEQVWLLGDSGYPQRPWLMTPYQDPSSAEQTLYNEKHGKARVIIENAIGRVKNQWRCCIKYRTPHYHPEKCAEIITACCVLHNFALEQNQCDLDNYSGDDGDDVTFVRSNDIEESGGCDLLRGRALRDQIARRLRNQ